MHQIKKQAPCGRVSRFTRSEIDLLFQHGKTVYKSKEFVILTAPCFTFKQSNCSPIAATGIADHKPNAEIACPENIKRETLQETGRILLITSRKVGNAPQRNLLRRRGRAIFYEERLFELGKHCVVIFKAPAKELTYQQFKEILVKSLLRQNSGVSLTKPLGEDHGGQALHKPVSSE